MNALLHQRMGSTFENYFELSTILLDDMNSLLDIDNDSQQWRRNFIRVSASLIEGYTHSIREMCAVGLKCLAPDVSSREREVIESETSFGAADRIKLTLRAAYTLFELQPAPAFGGNEWLDAQRVLKKRDSLMHPKIASDLHVSDDENKEFREATAWLMAQFFSIFSLLQVRHLG